MTDISDLLDELKDEATRLATERDEAEKRAEIAASGQQEAEGEAEGLRDKLEARGDSEDAIHVFLDECARPCGSHKFTIPDNPRVHDAIRAMADAIGRNV